MIYIFLIICLIFDYIYPLFIPSFFNNLNLFYPMFTLTYLVFLYKKINNKKYYKLIIISGILYDLLFSYLLLFHTVLFIFYYKILKKLDKFIELNIFIKILILIIFILIYDLLLFLLIYITDYNVVTINDLLYKFSHSIIINILYYIWLLIILDKKLIKK